MPVHTSISPASLEAPGAPPDRPASGLRAGSIVPGAGGSLWIAARKAELANAAGAAMAEGAALGDHWALYSTPAFPEETLYWVHDNGARPFLVRVTPFVFAVYVKDKTVAHDAQEYICEPSFQLRKGLTNDYDHPRHYTKLVAGSTPYQRLWAAEDTALPEDFALGHAVLLQLAGQQHMSIGVEVHVFDLAEGEVVQDFKSHVGNSDVPYPYIVTNQATYLTIEAFSAIPTSVRDLSMPDPYDQVYAFFHADAAARKADPSAKCADWPHGKLAPITVVCKRPW